MIFLESPVEFKPKFEVVSCLLEHDGEILLLRRQDHKPQGGTWGIPAGKVDDGEDQLTALKRETEQETGHQIGDNLSYFNTVYVRFPTHDFVYRMYHLPLIERPRIVINPNEHQEYCWRTPMEALTMDLIQDEDACLKMYYGI